MVQADLGEQVLEAEPALDGLAAMALVLVDDLHLLGGPAQGARPVRQLQQGLAADSRRRGLRDTACRLSGSPDGRSRSASAGDTARPTRRPDSVSDRAASSPT